MYMLWVAIVLGIVEGLTEFLPISSTGHLIVATEALEFKDDREEVFVVFIQLGAILSVVWEFREKLWGVARGVLTETKAQRFSWHLLVAFIPAAVFGLLFDDFIDEHLFSIQTVAWALIVGAILIFVVEGLPLKARTSDVDNVGWKQALGIGFAQCLALWPGFSRSAATILGGLGLGLDRRTATEFSFFLAIPVMFAAGFYKLLKGVDAMAASDYMWLALCFVISFLVAWASIRWLLRYVASHSFRPFAWYRLALGGALLIWVWRGGG